jgi:two-component system sensor histidine kinase DegS
MFTQYGNEVAERSSFQINFSIQGDAKHLSPHQIRQLFYIFREALCNSEKYAQASEVSVEFIWEDHMLKLVVADNGIGFDPHTVPASGHYGLKFMRERTELLKGSLSVQSALTQGTTISITVPCE